MTKKEFVAWWRDEALRNWGTAVFNMDGKQYTFALFSFHMTIEKLLKAIWVRDNIDNTPPRTHDLTALYNQSDLSLPNGWYDYLSVVGEWNIESRYPDYKLKLYKRADTSYLEDHFQKLTALKELLIDELSEH